jgi:hypothetical protein
MRYRYIARILGVASLSCEEPDLDATFFNDDFFNDDWEGNNLTFFS